MTLQASARSQPLLALHMIGAAWLSWRIIVLEMSAPSPPPTTPAREVAIAIPAQSVSLIESKDLPSHPHSMPDAVGRTRSAPTNRWLPEATPALPLLYAPDEPQNTPTASSTLAPSYPLDAPEPAQTPQPTLAEQSVRFPSALFEDSYRPRLRLDGWAVIRPGPASASLAPSLGGAQAGFRMRLPIVRGTQAFSVSATALVSVPLAQSGKEAGLGLVVRPMRTMPVDFIMEQRFALDRQGRTRLVALAAGGVSGKTVGHGWQLDGYAQAGVAGLRRRDVFADASASITRDAAQYGSVRFKIGASAWAAAQPGLHRIDAGPVLVLKPENLPVRLSLEWRQRIAGNAAPGSGPAMTLSGGF